jgi:hypothetical protein
MGKHRPASPLFSNTSLDLAAILEYLAAVLE